MADTPDTTRDPRFQIDKFRDAARELGCDEDEEALKAKVKEIARGPRRAPETKKP